VKSEDVGWWERLDPPKQGIRIRNPEKCQKLVKPCRIERGFDQATREYGLNFGRENERTPSLYRSRHIGVIKRLNANVIARQRQRALLIVPDCEMEHAIEARQTLWTPLRKGSQQNLRVGLSAERVALAY
jgi:hypothetical protein